MPIWPFQRRRANIDAETLLAVVTQASRNPAFFGEGRIADTLEGRFELMTLHAALALIRLKAEPSAEALGQTFTDALFSQFDAGLREAAVGDLAVPKRMHKLAGSFFGRLQAYEAAIGAGDDAALRQSISRNMLGVEDAAFADTAAAYVRRLAEIQATAPVAALLTPEGWAAPLS